MTCKRLPACNKACPRKYRAHQLNILVSPPNMILPWPTNGGFTLNQTSVLASPTIWMPVTNGISGSGTNYTITITTSSGNQFYTLMAP
jgi:hypothetical protein